MNTFFNPNKRSVSLLRGFKDLNDVLNPPKKRHAEKAMAIRHFVGLILQRAQRDGATEVVIGPAETKAVAVRYKVERTWREIEGAGHETPAMPSFDMRDVVSELTRLARLPEGPFPKAAVRSVSFEGDAEVRWKVEVKGTETDCVFTRLAK